jgi:hypothetical protein
MPRASTIVPLCAAFSLACAARGGGFDSPPDDAGALPPGSDAGAAALGDVVAPEAGRLGLNKVGDFDCIQNTSTPVFPYANAMTDIAVDRDGRIFGIASPTTAVCSPTPTRASTARA